MGIPFKSHLKIKDLTGLSEEVNTLEKNGSIFDTKRVTSHRRHYLVKIFRRPLGWNRLGNPPSKISQELEEGPSEIPATKEFATGFRRGRLTIFPHI